VKIWLLTSETPLYNPGGIARYVDNFARYLAALGHRVTVFGRDEEQRDAEVVPNYRYRSVVPKWHLCGEKATTPNPDDHPSYPYNVLDYWGAFSYQMAEAVMGAISEDGPPEIIESQEYCALPYYLLQRKLTGAGTLADIPVIVNAHSPDFLIRRFNEEPMYQLPHYWTGRLEMFCLHAADSVICPSAYLSRQLLEQFGNSIKVRHFPLPWTDPCRFPREEALNPRKVVCFGRLEVRKGTLRLLRECDRLWKDGFDFTLNLIGSDTDYAPRGCMVREWIGKAYAHWLEDGCLQIADSLPQEAVLAEVQRAACVLIPSLWENWPNTCIEAMSLGKVVVASENGGQAEMVGTDGSCGFVFSWEDAGGFRKALAQALSLSGAEREEMGNAAQTRIASMCAPEHVLPRRLAHFEEVLQSREAPDRFPFTNRRLRESPLDLSEPARGEQPGRVSVVIPYYNMGAYIRDTLTSVQKTDWPDLEIILLDDGSGNPESVAVLEELEREAVPGLRIHRQANAGLASARNTAVELATGQFILLLDADDAIEQTFIKRAIEVIRRYRNVHIVYSWERYMEASSDIYPCWNFEFPYLLGHNMTCPVSLLYRRAYREHGPSEPRMAYNFEDFELWIKLVAAGCGGVALPEPLTRYRVRSNSMWQGSPRRQHLFLQERITRLHPDLYAEYGAELFCLQNANGSSQKWIKPSANSPFDEFEQWSRRRIRYLEKEAKRWWEHSVGVEKELTQSEKERYAVWCEKNRIEEELLSLRKGESKS